MQNNEFFTDLRQKVFLLKQMTKRNLQSRFRGSMLSWLWSFLIPLLMLGVYTLIFGCFFKSRWGVDIGESPLIFALALFSGITLYNIFGESVSSSASVIVSNVNYVKKIQFPLEILPISQAYSTLILSFAWLLLLGGATIFLFHRATWGWLLLPFTLLPLFLFTIGVSLFIASLGVYFRDIQYLIGIILQMVFFLSPVFYRLGNLPEHYQKLVMWNPLVWFIELNRGVLFYRLFPEYGSLPGGMFWLVCYFCGIISFLLGRFWFSRTRKGFSDVL